VLCARVLNSMRAKRQKRSLLAVYAVQKGDLWDSKVSRVS